MATDRIIIHSSVAAAFLTALKSCLSSQYPASTVAPTVVSSAAKYRLQSLVSGAVSAGAQLFHGNHTGPNATGVNDSNNLQFAPQVLGNVTENMEIWQEEIFGPVVSYKLVQSEEEAIEVANRTGYGLSAAVFTKDLRKGFAIAKRIESG